MPIKNVFSTEIGEGSEKFKEFAKEFEKYRANVDKMPAAWTAMNKDAKSASGTLKEMTQSLREQNDLLDKELVTRESLEASTRRTAATQTSLMVSLANHAKSFMLSIKGGAAGLLAMAVPSAASVQRNVGHPYRMALALAGVGGTLYGLDRLGVAAGSGRRASTGLGLGYGEMTAFGSTYNRAVDAKSFMSAVSEARGNIGGGEASALMSIGLNPTGGGGLNAQALKRIWQMARGTPEELLGPVLQEGYGLGALGMSVQDLRRLRNMKPDEFDQYSKQFTTRSGQLDVDEMTLKKWQDFVNTLDTTGKRIESSLIRGLVKATGPLERLSDAAGTVVEKFMGSKAFGYVVDKITDGLDVFAKYVGTEKFKQDVDDFASGLAGLARFVRDFINLFGSGSSNDDTASGRAKRDRQKFGDYVFGPKGGTSSSAAGTTSTTSSGGGGTSLLDSVPGYNGNSWKHNPGSLMVPGSNFVLREFSSEAEGIRAMRDQLVTDIDKMHQDTLRQLIYGNKYWAGYVGPESDRATYLKNVSGWSGIGPDQKIGREDLASIMAAMTRQEGHPVPRQAIKIVIDNPAGSTVATQVNALDRSATPSVP